MGMHSIKKRPENTSAGRKGWDFYSSHANLQLITPPSMKFEIISQNNDEKLYSGQVIEYK
jgi:ligand-binding SRPBCC domain-containing protein